jgi:hypothetical protein
MPCEPGSMACKELCVFCQRPLTQGNRFEGSERWHCTLRETNFATSRVAGDLASAVCTEAEMADGAGWS